MGAIELRLGEVFEPYMRRGKDKSHTDNDDEDRDDSNDIEDAVVS